MSVEKPYMLKNCFIEYQTSKQSTANANEYEHIKTWFYNKPASIVPERLRSEKLSFNKDTSAFVFVFDGNQFLHLNTSIKSAYLKSVKNFRKNIIEEIITDYRNQFLPAFLVCERNPSKLKTELYNWFCSGDAQLKRMPDTVINGMQCFGFHIIDTTCHYPFDSENGIPGEEMYSLRSETFAYFNKADSVQTFLKTDNIFPFPYPVLSQWNYIINYKFNDTSNINQALYQINTDTLNEYFVSSDQNSGHALTSVRNIPFIKAPDIQGITYNGDTFNLYDVKAKMILLDFWGKYCSPCLSQMEDFKKHYKELKDLGLETYGINSQDIPSKNMETFLNDRKFKHPLIYSKSAANRYRVIAIPLYFLLDENYMIIESFYGLDKDKISEIKKRLLKF